MAAVWYRFRAELPKRWRAVLALALLAGVAGGIALTAAAGARRTDTAYERLLDKTNAWQVLVNPDDSNGTASSSPAIACLPMVTAAARSTGRRSSRPTPAPRTTSVASASSSCPTARRCTRWRSEDPARAGAGSRCPDEVLIDPSSRSRKASGSAAGSARTRSPTQTSPAASASGCPSSRAPPPWAAGVRNVAPLNVVGIGMNPDNIVVDEGFEHPSMTLSPAFAKRYPEAHSRTGPRSCACGTAPPTSPRSGASRRWRRARRSPSRPRR